MLEADLMLWVGISFEQSASTHYFRKAREFLLRAGRWNKCVQAIINLSEEAHFNLISACNNTGEAACGAQLLSQGSFSVPSIKRMKVPDMSEAHVDAQHASALSGNAIGKMSSTTSQARGRRGMASGGWAVCMTACPSAADEIELLTVLGSSDVILPQVAEAMQ